jgi:hypothetical protein
LSVFVTTSCDIRHNDDGICKIPSLVFCSLVDSSTSVILNYIHQITSKRPKCPDVAFIYRSKEYHSMSV